MENANLGFSHRWLPAASPEESATLLLLHGTGGDENDLLDLGAALAPGAARLSPRGKILERGMPRFFRRLAEGVFDEEDLIFRARELADFVTAASTAYGFDPKRVVATGFSNGANIAAAMLLLHPGVLAGAVLFHAMVPLEPPQLPNLSGVPIFLSAGRFDPIVPVANTEWLAEMLRAAGADVTLLWQDGGHALTATEARAVAEWLQHKQLAVGSS